MVMRQRGARRRRRSFIPGEFFWTGLTRLTGLGKADFRQEGHEGQEGEGRAVLDRINKIYRILTGGT
jgi:hypothetical protein